VRWFYELANDDKSTLQPDRRATRPKEANVHYISVLSYNLNNSDEGRYGVIREMKNVRSYRAMALLCSRQAVFHPKNSWKYLSDTERWEHLA
jgi:hypothetical protein